MLIDRLLGRNVQFYNATSPEVALGGLIQNGSVTEANFLDMLEILLITEMPIRVHKRDSGHIITRTNTRLEAGHHDVYCDRHIHVNNEPCVQRLISHNVSGRGGAFTTEIRARDGRCVISGLVNKGAYRGDWSRCEAAHIFPLNAESVWDERGYWRCIMDMDGTNGVSKPNSLQNGFLLRRDIHTMFEQYLISVNPDDNYKIVTFSDDLDGLDGRVLKPVCRNLNNPHSSVLANMRGAREPISEHDFSEKYEKERLEMEVAARLRGFVNV
ncbi:HNH endonuclease-domain-containing protein [Terfezia claveryi]|nr:HNH endonuclease-domain-containing protein [Terfezia claveryi]